MKITQSKYIKEILNKFGIGDSKPIGTPMSTRVKISKNDNSKKVDQISHTSIIGKLHYCDTHKNDIAFIVGMVARFSPNLKESHMREI